MLVTGMFYVAPNKLSELPFIRVPFGSLRQQNGRRDFPGRRLAGWANVSGRRAVAEEPLGGGPNDYDALLERFKSADSDGCECCCNPRPTLPTHPPSGDRAHKKMAPPCAAGMASLTRMSCDCCWRDLKMGAVARNSIGSLTKMFP